MKFKDGDVPISNVEKLTANRLSVHGLYHKEKDLRPAEVRLWTYKSVGCCSFMLAMNLSLFPVGYDLVRSGRNGCQEKTLM